MQMYKVDVDDVESLKQKVAPTIDVISCYSSPENPNLAKLALQ
jgi:hypothetical protein